jgi:signal transduction histidine kinase
MRLRHKILVLCVALVLAPVAIAWLGGMYERWVSKSIPAELRQISDALVAEAPRTSDAAGTWLDTFARKHRVFVRWVDARGSLVHGTDPLNGEGRVIRDRGFFGGVADFFYGPQGAPDILAFEQSLPPILERDEVRSALAGRPAETVREPASATMLVFYRAVLAPDGHGVLYVARASRRTVRALYDLRYQLLQLSLVLLVVASGMGLWIGWRVVRPVSRMQQAIHRYLATGKSVPLAMNRRDEIGDLSRDFEQLASRLERRLTETSRVTADLAHDLRSPLSTVTASAELLATGPLDDERRRRIAGAIAEAARHMTDSVQALLALARLDETLASEPRSPIALDALAARVVEEYQGDLVHRGKQLSVEHTAKPTVLGAEERLAQALRNLIDNAVSFCRASVLVRVDERAGAAVIEVLDDGPGVSPGNRDKIFRRFFSARQPEQSSGTGLGLAIVETVAHAHGGRVELSDGCELGGACFRLILPKA